MHICGFYLFLHVFKIVLHKTFRNNLKGDRMRAKSMPQLSSPGLTVTQTWDSPCSVSEHFSLSCGDNLSQ